MATDLAAGDVHVWHRATAALSDADVAALRSQLSPLEQEKCARFRFDRDRRDYAAAHALLRTGLSRYGDLPPGAWQFEQKEVGGKPSLVPCDGAPRLSFNLSHTHGLVACAISGGCEVGIDVERVDRDAPEVAGRFFSARENDRLRHSPSDALRAQRFIELWTLKEAYVKAIGQGLAHPLQSIEFDPTRRDAIQFLAPPDVDTNDWTFALTMPAAGYCLAVAVRREGRDVTIRMMDAED